MPEIDPICRKSTRDPGYRPELPKNRTEIDRWRTCMTTNVFALTVLYMSQRLGAMEDTIVGGLVSLEGQLVISG